MHLSREALVLMEPSRATLTVRCRRWEYGPAFVAFDILRPTFHTESWIFP